MSRAPSISAIKRKRPEAKSPLQLLSRDERRVYDVIHEKQDIGIPIRDIKFNVRDTVPDTVVTKIVKMLQARSLVKEVKNIQNKGRNHFMAVEFEPSTDLTGGDWYLEGKLNMNLIDLMNRYCLEHIRKREISTLEAITNALKSDGAINSDSSSEPVVQILNLLILDNKIVEVKSSGTGEFSSIKKDTTCYKIAGNKTLGPKRGAMASIPCGVCPVISLCTPDGLVSPKTCPYYKKWLEEF